MKYWIFQSNQVLGPYEPDDLGRHSAFGAESLVCPEGRRGTSMGDWQRAGMVPDLSVALVKAAQSSPSKTSVATLAGLPPEPTLKDLAVLGSLQEKMTMLEDVVIQLQEGLRLKDSELASLHQELAGKERQSSVMKTAMEREAEDLKRETEERKREADERKHEAETLKAEADESKRKMKELEERLGALTRLSETIEKAVESERNVESDVEAQGATLAELSKEIETLRAQLGGRLSAAPAPEPSPFAPAAAASAPAAAPVAPLAADSAPVPAWSVPSSPMPGATFDPAEMPAIAPPPAPPAPAPMPSLSFPAPGDMPNIAPPPALAPAPMPDFAPAPMTGLGLLPSFGSPEDPMGSAPVPGSPEAALEPAGGAAAVSVAPAFAAVATDLSPVRPKSRKKAVIFGVLAGTLAVAALAVFSGRLAIPGLTPAKSAASAGESVTPAMPIHAPEPPAPAPLATPAPVVDPRETAIDAAKEWELPDGRTLGQALETLSPPSGNLSPWMAEPSPTAENRVSVNYFAQPSSPGAPTVAYQFEVDLGEKTLVGRNPAAKAVLAGKAVPPPAPPKSKPVKIKPKAKPKTAAKPKKEENIDALLGSDSATSPTPATAPKSAAADASAATAPAADAATAGDDAASDSGDAPAPANPATAKRAAKAAAPAAGKASDESLLDDILKE